MHAAYGAFLHGHGMIDLGDSLGVPDLLQFSRAKNPGKEATIVFKGIRVNQVCAVKGKLFEVHVFGSWLIGASLQCRRGICSVFRSAGNGNYIAATPSCLILLLRALKSRLNPS